VSANYALLKIASYPKAIPAIIEALKDKDWDVRTSAASALGGIGPDARAAVPVLIEALKDEHFYVRSSAAHALGGIGPEARAAVPALTMALKDEDKDVRRAAAEALKKVRGKGDKAEDQRP